MSHVTTRIRCFFPIGSLPLTLLALLILAYLAYDLFSPKPPPKPDATWTRIKEEGVVRIGADPSLPPFIVDDGQGNLWGLDVALANELAKRWGVRVQYVYTGYDGLYEALKAKQFDLILSALPYNPSKTEDVYFSHSYFNGGPVLVVREEDRTTTGLEGLAGRALAVELGSNGDAVARKWQRRYNLRVHHLDTAIAALRALQAGLAAGAIVDPISFYDFQRIEPEAQHWRIVGKPLADDFYVIAVRKDSPTLLREINAAIDALKREGKLKELERQIFSRRGLDSYLGGLGTQTENSLADNNILDNSDHH